MDTRKLDEGSRLLGAISWAAIATGVFVALALQTLLLLLGLGFGLSIGDGTVGGAYAVWAVVVQLCSIAVGAALAAALSHTGHRMGGVAAGVMTWAVALVLGGLISGFSLMQRLDGAGAWSAFFGALLGLGAAIVGGAFGATIAGAERAERTEPLSASPLVTPP